MKDYQKDVEIAKYLGAKKVNEKTLNSLMVKWECQNFPLLHGKFVSGHELKFSVDYNWIMPVVILLRNKLNIDPLDKGLSLIDIRNSCYNYITHSKKYN